MFREPLLLCWRECWQELLSLPFWHFKQLRLFPASPNNDFEVSRIVFNAVLAELLQ
jgi:hypothetical protein